MNDKQDTHLDITQLFFTRNDSLHLKNKNSIIKSLKPNEFKNIKTNEIDLKFSFHFIKEYISTFRQGEYSLMKKSSILVTGTRRSYIKYLINLIRKYNFQEETFYNALDYLDTILLHEEVTISKNKINLVVIGCFLLSGKINFNLS
jgi:hypothetical protein